MYNGEIKLKREALRIMRSGILLIKNKQSEYTEQILLKNDILL